MPPIAMTRATPAKPAINEEYSRLIRPISTRQAGAVATIAFFTAMGLFQGQSEQFFDFITSLAEAADAAKRDID